MPKRRKWRVDVRYLLPERLSVGIVNHPPGKPDHPTLFLEAIPDSKHDEAWFERMVEEIVDALNARGEKR